MQRVYDDVQIKEFPEVDFQKKQLPTNFTISTLKFVRVGQLVTIKAKVWPGKRKRTLTLHRLTVETVYYPFSIRLKWFV